MAMGRRKKQRQQSLFVAATDLPQSAAHPFYAKLNDVLADYDLLSGKTIGVDATTPEANAAMRSIVRKDIYTLSSTSWGTPFVRGPLKDRDVGSSPAFIRQSA
jgi:hypothetical protein